MAKVSPTQRSLKLLRSQGYHAEVVEWWDSRTKCRHDLLGFADILAMRPKAWLLNKDHTKEFVGGLLLVQTTDGSSFSKRVRKVLEEPRSKMWLDAGGAIECHGWRKLKTTGKWEARIWQP